MINKNEKCVIQLSKIYRILGVGLGKLVILICEQENYSAVKDNYEKNVHNIISKPSFR